MDVITYMLLLWGVITTPAESIKYQQYLDQQQLESISEAYVLYQELVQTNPDNPEYDIIKKQYVILLEDIEL